MAEEFSAAAAGAIQGANYPAIDRTEVDSGGATAPSDASVSLQDELPGLIRQCAQSGVDHPQFGTLLRQYRASFLKKALARMLALLR